MGQLAFLKMFREDKDMCKIKGVTKLEHLKFMGIPIDGKIKQFGKSLEKKGLRYYTKINSNQYIYKGTFAGDEANIYAMYDIKSQIVYGVGVDIYRDEQNASLIEDKRKEDL